MRNKKEKWMAFLLVSPSILAVAVFVYGFIGWTARVSFTAWRGMIPDYTFVKLANYIDLFVNNQRFQIDIRNTLMFTGIFVVGTLLLGLASALLLDQGLRGEGFFRSLYIFPMAISYIVTGVVWRWLMNPAQGSRISGLNLLFQSLHLDFLNSSYTATPYWGMAFIALPAIWQLSGYTMALYLAGLRAIPDELREAARVDGATELQIFRFIVMPLLRPVTLAAMIILGHMSLKTFDLVIAVAGKQLPLDMPSINMWQTTFDAHLYGSGAAISILLLLSTAVLIIPYLFFSPAERAANMNLNRSRYWSYIPLGLLAIFYLIPLYVMVATGFKGADETSLKTMWDLPKSIDFVNYITAFGKLAPNLWNSLNVVIPAAILSSILGSLNGYVLAKWKFKGADVIFPLILFGMFIPYQSILIPLVQFMHTIGLYGGLPGLVLVHIIYGIPITTLTFRNYYASIPNELLEAAKIDGAGMMSIYWNILIPISIPSFVVVLIWQFTQAWNDFLFSVVLTSPQNWTVTVALNNISGGQIIPWNVQMAGSLLAALPTLIVYIFLGRYFLRGMMAGSLKG